MDVAIAAAHRPKGDVNALVRLAERDMAAVDALILDRMQSDVPIIPKLAEHLVSAGGKRLRPLLTVAAARAARSARREAVAARDALLVQVSDAKQLTAAEAARIAGVPPSIISDERARQRAATEPNG